MNTANLVRDVFRNSDYYNETKGCKDETDYLVKLTTSMTSNKPPKVFISGKITGDPFYQIKFQRAEEKLRNWGYRVINPAVLPVDLGVNECMQITITMLGQCDAVYMLKDWKESRGATIEHEFASYAGKAIIYEEREY